MRSFRKQSHIWAALPIVLGLALRIIFLIQVWDDPFFFDPVLEDRAHWDRALRIQEGDMPEGELPAGGFIYAYCVAAISTVVGRNPEAIFFVQILLDLLIIYLIGRLGSRLGGPWAGFAGSLLYAVNPLPMAYAARLSPVIAAALLFLYSALRLYPAEEKVRSAGAQGLGAFIACGLLLGLGTLLIPLPFIALGVAAVAFLWHRRVPGRVQRAAALVIGAAVLMLPALLHNSGVRGGAFSFAWTDGWGYSQAFRPETWGTPWSAELPSWEDSDMLRFRIGNDIGRDATWGDVERWHVTRGTQRFLETPLPSLILVLKKALLSVTRVEIPDPVPVSGALIGWAPAFRWGLWLFPFLLGLFVMEIVTRLRSRTLPLVLTVPLLALAADHILGPLSSAARALALPWIAALSGVALLRIAGALRERELRSLVLPVAAGILVCAVSLADLPGAGKKLLREDETLRLLAHAKEKAGKRPEAMRILQQAARIAPEPNAWIYSDLGAYLARETLYEQSIESYRRGLLADSTHAESLLGIASVLRASGGSPEALEYLEKLVALHPNVPLYHNEIGTLCMSLGLLTRARVELERAVVLNPDYVTALQNLRALSMQQRQLEELVVPPEMSIAPDDPLHGISQQMVAGLQANDVARVDSLAAVARRMRPDHILPDIMQGMVRMQIGEWQAALPFLEATNEKVPGRAHVVRQLVTCYLELKRFDDALAILDRALEQSADENNHRLILDLRATIQSKLSEG